MKNWRKLLMGKKKQLKKLAEANIKVLKSGKLKIAKGQKISLKPLINESVSNSIVSRLDGIISKEEAVVETEKLVCDVTTNLTDEIHTVDLASKVNSPVTQTIVISLTKKEVGKAFDYLKADALGILLRTSTLGSIYKSIRDKWIDLNRDDETCFTNVLFIPKVLCFIDFNTGELRKFPLYVNVLIVVTPIVKKMEENSIEETTEDDASARVIADITEAAIKCGCKNIVVNPFGNKILTKDLSATATMWNRVTTGERFLEQIDSCIFAMEDESNYIIFNATRKTN
jgi:uncharacterized protein (TIGR02452 family)